MPTPKPACLTLFAWLKTNLGPRCLAPLTGTDFRSLRAAVMIVDAYAYNRTADLAMAFGLCVGQMQPSTRYMAYHAIAHIMDWQDRASFWALAGLDVPDRIPVCVYGPGGSKH